jgi:hypothetical protein
MIDDSRNHEREDITIAATCFGFDENHHQGARKLCFAKLLKWYQLIHFVIKIVRFCGRMPVHSCFVCVRCTVLCT